MRQSSQGDLDEGEISSNHEYLEVNMQLYHNWKDRPHL
jgi:hypothetical protein